MTRRLAQALRRALDLVFPPTCLSCNAETTRHGLLCVDCFRGLGLMAMACSHCASPLAAADYADSAGRCASCAQARFPWQRAHAAFQYEGTARKLVLQLKYADRPDIVPFLARAMLEALGGPVSGAPVLVPVPLHRRRFWRRRFNQSALLANALAGLMPGSLCLPDALVRCRATQTLARLSPEERSKALEGAILPRSSGRDRIAGAHVLLVDDVLTTGATASICARQLLGAGARRVDLVVVARAVRLDRDHERYDREQG